MIGWHERTAHRLYRIATRLAPAEFAEAERLAALAEELDEIKLAAPPLDYPDEERRTW